MSGSVPQIDDAPVSSNWLTRFLPTNKERLSITLPGTLLSIRGLRVQVPSASLSWFVKVSSGISGDSISYPVPRTTSTRKVVKEAAEMNRRDPKDRTLLDSFVKHVFSRLEEYGLDPAEFVWHEDARQGFKFSTIVHEPTGFYFEFAPAGEGFAATWSPGRDKVRESQQANDFNELRDVINNWAGWLKNEIGLEDPWDRIRRGFVAPTVGDDRPFAESERHAIGMGMQELRVFALERIEQSDRLEDHKNEIVAYIKERCDRIEAAIETQSRQDWALMFWGMLFNFLMTIGQQEARDIVEFALGALGSVIGASVQSVTEQLKRIG